MTASNTYSAAMTGGGFSESAMAMMMIVMV